MYSIKIKIIKRVKYSAQEHKIKYFSETLDTACDDRDCGITWKNS
jgi:hypothetical protein